MFEVLMFLFENYLDAGVAFRADKDVMLLELQNIGFERDEICRALDWLEGLNECQLSIHAAPTSAKITEYSIRHYLPEEADRLGPDGIGFLFYLERIGILDPATREIIIDRLMVLNGHEVDFGRVKWVVLMVLFSQPGKKAVLNILQEMILADGTVLH